MDLSIWFSDGFAFGWSQFEAVDWAVVPCAYLLENRVCRGYFNLHNLFVKPDHHEELKPTVAVLSTFNLSLPLFFAIGLEGH
jgi:hypothetical protein